MQITRLHELGWAHFFQSQLTLETLETALPFRVTGVQRNLIECLGLDAHGQVQSHSLSTYPWRNEPPENHPTVGDWLLLDHALHSSLPGNFCCSVSFTAFRYNPRLYRFSPTLP
jgi:ribosome biogenesis GTPase